MDTWYERTIVETDTGFRVRGDLRDRLPLASLMVVLASLCGLGAGLAEDEQTMFMAGSFACFVLANALMVFLDGLSDVLEVDDAIAWGRRSLPNLLGFKGSRTRSHHRVDLRTLSQLEQDDDAVVMGTLRLPIGLSIDAVMPLLREAHARVHRESLVASTTAPIVSEDAHVTTAFEGPGRWRPDRGWWTLGAGGVASASVHTAIAIGPNLLDLADSVRAQILVGMPFAWLAAIGFVGWLGFHALRPDRHHTLALTEHHVIVSRGQGTKRLAWAELRSVQLSRGSIVLVLQQGGKVTFGGGWPVQARVDARAALAHSILDSRTS